MSKYLRYVIKNIAPLRVADDSTSQSGQTSTLKHIPGTTIRGYVVNYIANRYGLDAEDKGILFSSKIRFLNAYMAVSQQEIKELIPSPKGFYEDKNPDNYQIQNVVEDGNFTDGYKRAGLGRFCYIQDGCICYYSVETGSDLRILIDKKNEVFRNESILPGNIFVGYIAIDDNQVAEKIKEALQGTLYLGNCRSQGYGKCQVLEVSVSETLPYGQYAETQNQSSECYMMLLSHTTMRNDFGEYCGIDEKMLGDILQVSDLEIIYASSSIVNVRGYNREYSSKIPSVPMYEYGSVFHLRFKGELTVERMNYLMNHGLGVRTNEGFGRVLFLKNYVDINRKQPGGELQPATETEVVKYPEDDKTLQIIAKNYYRLLLNNEMQKLILDGTNSVDISASQVGNILSLLESNKYAGHKGAEAIQAYFNRAKQKEEKQNIHKDKGSIEAFAKRIITILEQPFVKSIKLSKDKIMGIDTRELLSEDEEYLYKFKYLIALIKYEGK